MVAVELESPRFGGRRAAEDSPVVGVFVEGVGVADRLAGGLVCPTDLLGGLQTVDAQRRPEQSGAQCDLVIAEVAERDALTFVGVDVAPRSPLGGVDGELGRGQLLLREARKECLGCGDDWLGGDPCRVDRE